MSEEENKVETEPTETQAEPQPSEVEQAPQDQPLFKALFEASEAEAKPEETPEVEEQEMVTNTLSEAVDSLSEEPEEVVEETEEVQEEEKEEAKKEGEVAKKATPKKKKIKKVVDPDIEIPSTPQYFPEEDPDKEFVDGLLPEEKEVYELAKFASENQGKQGIDREFKDYFTKTKSYVDKRLQDDPNVDLSNDEDYRSFIQKNRPNFSQADMKSAERELVLQKAEKRAMAKLAPEIERVRREQERAQKAPVIQQAKTNFRRLSTKAIPKEFHETLNAEGGVEKLQKENPLEYQILDNITRELHDVGDLLVDITQGNVDYDEHNQVHVKLLKWVNDEQENFINSGQTQHEGKIFMRRERFYQLPENKRSEYYTWSDDDLLALLTARASQRVSQSLEQQRKLLADAGYTRGEQAQTQVAAPQSVPTRQAPPVVASKPRPGHTPAATPNKEANNPMLSILGF